MACASSLVIKAGNTPEPLVVKQGGERERRATINIFLVVFIHDVCKNEDILFKKKKDVFMSFVANTCTHTRPAATTTQCLK